MIDQHWSLAEKFIKKWVWLYIFSFIIAPMGYIIKIIVSWELSVSELWILYGIISLITMISAYNDFWMTESINHFVPKFVTEKRFDKVKSILLYALIAQMSTGISIALFFYFWADYISEHYFKSIAAAWSLKVFAFYFLGINVLQILTVFLQSIQNTFLQKSIELIRMICTLLLTVWVFMMDYGSLVNYSYTLVLGIYIWIIFAVTLFYFKYFKLYFQNERILWDKDLFITIFKYWGLVFLWSQAWVILSQIDMQMIIFMLGTTDAWYYTNYLSIISIPFMIIGPIFGLLFPVFSELHSKWENDKITLVKSIFTNNFLIIGLAFNIFLFTFSLPIAYVLFWIKYLTSGVILQYSVLFLVFNFLLQINFSILAWVWKVKERLKIVLAAVWINFVTNIIFIYLFWVIWAAIATWIGWIYMWGATEYFTRDDYPLKLDKINIIKNVLFLWVLSFIILYIFWNFTYFTFNISRIFWFFILLWTSLIYFCIFFIINYSMFQNFYSEIKKLRK